MDNEIRELKELVRNQTALIEETNRMVKKIRAASRWSFIFTLVWWLSVIGVSGALYFVFAAPYVEQIMEIYGSAQDIISNFRSAE